MSTRLSFFEIPSANFYRAVDFYKSVFNLELSICEGAEEKMAFFPSDENTPAGAVIFQKDYKPSKDGVLIHLTCNDIEKTLENVVKNGGRILREKTQIEADNMGYFALFIDSEGNQIGIHAKKLFKFFYFFILCSIIVVNAR